MSGHHIVTGSFPRGTAGILDSGVVAQVILQWKINQKVQSKIDIARSLAGQNRETYSVQADFPSQKGFSRDERGFGIPPQW